MPCIRNGRVARALKIAALQAATPAIRSTRDKKAACKAAATSNYAAGKITVKVVPLPSVDRTSMVA